MNYSSPKEKLIRDRIGERIMNSSESQSIRVVHATKEKVHFLILKFTEELSEFYEADEVYKNQKNNTKSKIDAIYEIADVLEVLDTLISLGDDGSHYVKVRLEFIQLIARDYRDYHLEDILDAQRDKRDRLGGFDDGYILIL